MYCVALGVASRSPSRKAARVTSPESMCSSKYSLKKSDRANCAVILLPLYFEEREPPTSWPCWSSEWGSVITEAQALQEQRILDWVLPVPVLIKFEADRRKTSGDTITSCSDVYGTTLGVNLSFSRPESRGMSQTRSQVYAGLRQWAFLGIARQTARHRVGETHSDPKSPEASGRPKYDLLRFPAKRPCKFSNGNDPRTSSGATGMVPPPEGVRKCGSDSHRPPTA
ncbi:hypothetical protein EDB85DRAFT_1886534 [Lactarius pseudohatsudake]|nr:hypothetical protein EDB85DRAFT_1886534 [Lactarius pseudohatsudake]